MSAHKATLREILSYRQLSVAFVVYISIYISYIHAGASIPWGNEAEIFIIAILRRNIFIWEEMIFFHFKGRKFAYGYTLGQFLRLERVNRGNVKLFAK